MKEFMYSILVTSIIVLAIIVTLTYVQPFLYRRLPSDKDRHLVIMNVLNDRKKNKEFIVFGDSRAMFGVDTRTIKDSMTLQNEVLNLSSVGQNIYESSYFYGLLDSTTKGVIQCTSPSFFSTDIKHELQDDVAYSMYLSGYRINEETKSVIKNYNPIFDGRPFINYLKSRSIIRCYIHSNILRPVLDNETSDRVARGSIYFPHSFTSNRHPNYPVYEFDCSHFKRSSFPSTQISFLIKVHDFFKTKGIDYVIVLMPVNPDECNECYRDFKEYKRMIQDLTDIRVIDITELLLDTNCFYDAIHANKEGARIISSQIGNELLMMGFNMETEE